MCMKTALCRECSGMFGPHIRKEFDFLISLLFLKLSHEFNARVNAQDPANFKLFLGLDQSEEVFNLAKCFVDLNISNF